MLQYRDAGSDTLSDMDIREEVNTFMFAVSFALILSLHDLKKIILNSYCY